MTDSFRRYQDADAFAGWSVYWFNTVHRHSTQVFKRFMSKVSMMPESSKAAVGKIYVVLAQIHWPGVSSQNTQLFSGWALLSDARKPLREHKVAAGLCGSSDTTQGAGFRKIFLAQSCRDVRDGETKMKPCHFITALTRWIEEEGSILVVNFPVGPHESQRASQWLSSVTNAKSEFLDWSTLLAELRQLENKPAGTKVYDSKQLGIVGRNTYDSSTICSNLRQRSLSV